MDLFRVITMADVRNSIDDKKLCVWGMDYFLSSNNLTRNDLLEGKVTVQTLLESKQAMAEEFVRNLHGG